MSDFKAELEEAEPLNPSHRSEPSPEHVSNDVKSNNASPTSPVSPPSPPATPATPSTPSSPASDGPPEIIITAVNGDNTAAYNKSGDPTKSRFTVTTGVDKPDCLFQVTVPIFCTRVNLYVQLPKRNKVSI
ncbi:hypothetical protein LOTGIDRAFT_164804 [Lottia gigantea]|uniref:Uncharacterized protein n=1 Tax=Lottia gigantea TaxID=225164 RepID=V4A8Z5_LOTGI|nr:hypothetical protein LOTGIDRAFT_164804 [Lottia gigantea]ESO89776.1 hypothetical protein LOTGIDRAFT_164804 [Lottia gigantea]